MGSSALPDEAYLAGDGRDPGRRPGDDAGRAVGADRPRRPGRGSGPGPGRPSTSTALWAATPRRRGRWSWAAATRTTRRRCGTIRSRRPCSSVGATSASLDRRRVGVVGTRRGSRYGLDVATQLGERLGAAGVAVVSGLALGVDGAVHRGLLRTGGAPPIGVVGSGLDVVYPGGHRDLWRQVGEEGLLLSEMPLGRPADPLELPGPQPDHRRPERGRRRGRVGPEGRLALHRGRGPGPGPPAVRRARARSPARRPRARTGSSPTGPCPCARSTTCSWPSACASPTGSPTPVPEPGGPAGRVLDACAHESVTLQTLVDRSGLTLPEVAAAIDELCRTGWLAESAGRYERTTPVRGVTRPARSGARRGDAWCQVRRGQSRPASLRA